MTENTKTVDSFYLPGKGVVSLDKADIATLRHIIQVQQDTIADLNSFLADGSPENPTMALLMRAQVEEVHLLRQTFIAAISSGAISREAFSGFQIGVELMAEIRDKSRMHEIAKEVIEQQKSGARVKIKVGREEMAGGETSAKKKLIISALQVGGVLVFMATLSNILSNALVRWFGWGQ